MMLESRATRSISHKKQALFLVLSVGLWLSNVMHVSVPSESAEMPFYPLPPFTRHHRTCESPCSTATNLLEGMMSMN